MDCQPEATEHAFSLPRRRGEGGRRPDEGCGRLHRRTQPLTPALSPHPMKGEGAGAHGREEVLDGLWQPVAGRARCPHRAGGGFARGGGALGTDAPYQGTGRGCGGGGGSAAFTPQEGGAEEGIRKPLVPGAFLRPEGRAPGEERERKEWLDAGGGRTVKRAEARAPRRGAGRSAAGRAQEAGQEEGSREPGVPRAGLRAGLVHAAGQKRQRTGAIQNWTEERDARS